MTKLRKQRRRKRYGYNVNRKRLRNKIRKTPVISCPQVKQAWVVKASVKSNLKNMGLAYDANIIPSISSNKLIKTEHVKPNEKEPEKLQVISELEEDAHAPRERGLRLPKSHVQWVTYLMDKYGEDYEAMARDKKNYYQETWQQIRRKIKQFKGIPEQYNEYLASKEGSSKEDTES
ncbi:nucleolar protein 16 [Macrosteles quadrilineatus]|uniref:nucleolar protein 16 n=1 Tax=Macrosteles quadrilineatus TaxID=74068 RepID=UPI0023E1C4BA|nr:nucleolar protein 16 [Macrosteles quadrilineatus]